MPKIDIYGTQQPIALLKFLIERNQLYERSGELILRDILDTQYIGACTPPSGGNNAVDPWFMSLFNCINITFPSKSAQETIYTSILSNFLSQRDYPEEIHAEVSTKVTKATI